jgi:cell division protein FtsQ
MVIMGFVSSRSSEVLCTHVEVEIADTLSSHFLSRSDIRSVLETSEQSIQGYPIAGIHTGELEQLLEQNPYIRNAEVSTEVNGTLHVSIEQRVPLIRIMPGGQAGYYLDREGSVLPLSDQFASPVILATGNLPKRLDDAEMPESLSELYHFCRYLSEHDFWKEQIVQIYVNRKGEYELIPRVGAHQILFGPMEGWELKMKNLELLYRQGFPAYGWNRYETINLKYSNQVICTKR